MKCCLNPSEHGGYYRYKMLNFQTITHKAKFLTSACFVTRWNLRVCSLSNHFSNSGSQTHFTRFIYFSSFSESYDTADGPSVSLPCNKAPIWGLRPDCYYYQTVGSLITWGALSEESTGLSFTIATSPRQRSHSRVRVP
jgi:hypothetical protein